MPRGIWLGSARGSAVCEDEAEVKSKSLKMGGGPRRSTVVSPYARDPEATMTVKRMDARWESSSLETQQFFCTFENAVGDESTVKNHGSQLAQTTRFCLAIATASLSPLHMPQPRLQQPKKIPRGDLGTFEVEDPAIALAS